MKLIKLKTEAEIKKVLGEHILIESEGCAGNINRIVIGDPKLPTAVIKKGGQYENYFEVSVPETVEEFMDITDIAGARAEKRGSEEELNQWRKDLEREMPCLSLTFERKKRTVLVTE